LSTLKSLTKDPALARIISKNDGAGILANSLKKLAVINKDEKGLDDPELKSDPEITDIIGSPEINDRVVE